MKVIVADDEKWVRATIIKTIPFETLGLTLVCEASNGLEALELCKVHKPDILLTDIRMPGLTGLELIKEVRTILPQTKVVIISGYSDFEYAKTAMNYGVTDYILKPVDENEITGVLSKIKESILSEKKQIETDHFLKTQFKESMHVLRDKYLIQLISPHCFTLENIKNELVKYNIHFVNHHYTVLTLIAENNAFLSDSFLKKLYKNLVRRVMKRYLKAVTFSNVSKEDEIVCIVNHEKNTCQEQIKKAFTLCSSIFQRHTGTSLSIGISSVTSQILKLPELYAQTLEALQTKFWKSNEQIFIYIPQSFTDQIDIDIPEELLQNIAVNIKISDCQPAFSYIDSISHQIKNRQPLKPDLVKELLWNLVQSVINKAGIQMSFNEYVLANSGIHPYERIKKINSMEQLIDYTKELFGQICALYSNKNPKEGQDIIQEAKKFIEENFDKNISLEQVSKYIHLNPTYFSELFKKETGMSFVDYKTFLRMEHAKTMLSSSGMNVDVISSRLGYTDPKYFSKLFKKITGFTPQEYKKKLF